MRDSTDAHRSLAEVEVRWSAERNEGALHGLHRKKRRRTLVRSAAGSLVVLLALGVGLQHLTATSTSSPPQSIAEAPPDNPLEHRLADGSTVVRRDQGAIYDVVEDTSTRSVLRLRSGTIDIDRSTASSAPGKMTLLSHEVRIVVYAPALWASHSSIATVVSPLRGHLEVTVANRIERVSAGERAEFPSVVASAAAVQPKESSAPKPQASTPHAAAPGKKWRSLAGAGEFDKAYQELDKIGLDSVSDRVNDLMLAADVARISGHAKHAAKLLSRVLKAHSSDPQAPLAAFTLGKIQLDKMGQPAAAARAFRKAYLLRPSGALAEDALAREVEALARAGEMDQAKRRAGEYLSRYPRGHRSLSVKQYLQ